MARWRRLLAHSRQATTFWRNRDCLLCPCSIATAVRRLPSSTVVSHLQLTSFPMMKGAAFPGHGDPSSGVIYLDSAWMSPGYTAYAAMVGPSKTRDMSKQQCMLHADACLQSMHMHSTSPPKGQTTLLAMTQPKLLLTQASISPSKHSAAE